MTDHAMTSAIPETGGATFRVRDRASGELCRVYHVVRAKGYPHFLVRRGGEWRYLSAKHFIPEEATEK